MIRGIITNKKRVRIGQPCRLVHLFEFGDKTNRISEDNYKVFSYQKDGSLFSNISILNRQIERTDYEGQKCIRITESETEPRKVNKTTIFINDKTLGPLYYEIRVNDTVTEKADFDHQFMWFTDSVNSKGGKKKIEIQSSFYLSNSFSELVECVDFKKYPKVRFETISPGKAPHQFFAERIAEKDIRSLVGQLDCWLLSSQ